MPNLQTLPNELILRTLALSDVARVLSLGQTCKRFNAIASSKAAWIDIVSNLQHRGLIARRLAPDLGLLTKDQLVALVKRLVNGPASWSPTPGSPIAAAKISGSTVLAIEQAHGVRISPDASGEYLFIQIESIIECYAIPLGQKVWTSEPPSPEYEAFKFMVERHPGEIIILIEWEIFDGTVTDKSFFQVVRLDLPSHRTTELLWLPVDVGDRDEEDAAEYIYLGGDIFVYRYITTAAPWCALVLVDWRKLTVGVVHSAPRFDMAISGTFIATLARHHDAATGDFIQFSVYALSDIYAQLSVISTPPRNTEPVPRSDLVPLALDRVSPALTMRFEFAAWPEDANPPFEAISMFTNPLAEDTYRVWLSMEGRPRRRDSSGFTDPEYALQPISVVFPAVDRQRCALRAQASSSFGACPRIGREGDITFSGYSKIGHGTTERGLVHAAGLPPATVDLSEWLRTLSISEAHCTDTYMAAYSGDMIEVFSSNKVVVWSFE